MIKDEALFSLDNYAAAILSEADGPAVQGLCEQCADYYEINTALPPGPAEAQSLFLALPEGRNYSDKVLIGIFEDGQDDICGLLDVIKNYPDEGVWMLGLFLLAPDKRGQGFGREFYLSFEKWALKNGAKTIRIGVIEHNSRALKFWRDLGFLEIERKSPYTFGKRESALLVLTRNCL